MSRGLGALQRKVLDALVQRQDNDFYDAADLVALIDTDDTPVIRARWRWYTVDLLDLVRFDAPRSERVSLHRAVRSLHRIRQLEIATICPYPARLGGYPNDYDEWVGGLWLHELNLVDPRWPGGLARRGRGRRLWFRLPAPADDEIPVDDQIAFLDYLDHNPEAFQEFTRTPDIQEAWSSAVGSFVKWLFCGPSPASAVTAPNVSL